jgi:hypothetical protein
MNTLTGKKAPMTGRSQFNVMGQNHSPATQAKIESNPAIKKKFDALHDQIANLLSELPP